MNLVDINRSYNPLPGAMPLASSATSLNDALTRLEPFAPAAGAELQDSMLPNAQELVIALVALLAGLLQGAPMPPNGQNGAQAQDEGVAPVDGANNMDRMQSTNAVNSVSDSAGSGDTVFPVEGYQGKVELHHGSSKGAADLFAPRGTPVRAMRAGTVQQTGSGGAGGNTVTIKGDDNLLYYYAHLDQAPSVQQGQKVKAGEQIGAVGDSGNAKGTGTHLHIGIGQEIQNGTGPEGGAGTNYDAVGALNAALRK